MGDREMEFPCHWKALEAVAAVLRHRSAGIEIVWGIAHTVTTPRRRTWRRLLDHRHVIFHMPLCSAFTARSGPSSFASRTSTGRGFLKVCNFSCPLDFFSCITTNRLSRVDTSALARAVTWNLLSALFLSHLQNCADEAVRFLTTGKLYPSTTSITPVTEMIQ